MLLTVSNTKETNLKKTQKILNILVNEYVWSDCCVLRILPGGMNLKIPLCVIDHFAELIFFLDVPYVFHFYSYFYIDNTLNKNCLEKRKVSIQTLYHLCH